MPFLFNNANMYIDQYNGIIGIGTNTPTSNLHVIGSSVITGNLNVSGFTSITNASFSSSITLTGLIVNNALNVSSTGNVGIGIGTAVSNSNIHVQGTSKFLSSTGSTGMHINTLGNVGIGTSTPSANLHVVGYTQILGSVGTGGMFIDTVGEVGINTATPTSNLHVLGTTQILGISGSTGLYVGNIGNVGIGTAFSMANLHVLGHTRLLNNLNNTGLYVHTTGNVGIGTSVPTGNLHVLGYSQILGLVGTNGLYVSNVGNVGIGSTNPQYNLDVIGSFRTSNISVFQGPGTAFTPFGFIPGMDGNHCCIQLNANATGDTYMDFSNIGNDYFGRIYYSNSAHSMQFITRQSEKMRIDINGNIGINTSSPTCNLHVFTGATTLSTTLVAANIGGTLAILHGYNDGFGRFISALDTNMSTTSIRYISFGQQHTSLNSAELGFYYAGSGSSSNYLRIGLMTAPAIYCTGSGYVGIGTTNPSYPLYVATGGTTYSGTSKYYFGQSSTTTALIAGGGGPTNVSAVFQGDIVNISGNFVAYSDVRIKKDIVSLDTNYCLELLLQLRVVEHGYIDTFKNAKKKINFIAQEVEEVLPLAVETVQDYIPSIFNKYSYTKITDSKYCILDITFNFIKIGKKLKILTEKEECICTVINITETNIIILTEKELTGEIFVYGHSVDDCRTLNNDTLYTICIGAVQENNKRIKILEQKIVLLEEKLNKLL
jgi:hypothetical protein